jgi:hypothetical protein
MHMPSKEETFIWRFSTHPWQREVHTAILWYVNSQKCAICPSDDAV